MKSSWKFVRGFSSAILVTSRRSCCRRATPKERAIRSTASVGSSPGRNSIPAISRLSESFSCFSYACLYSRIGILLFFLTFSFRNLVFLWRSCICLNLESRSSYWFQMNSLLLFKSLIFRPYRTSVSVPDGAGEFGRLLGLGQFHHLFFADFFFKCVSEILRQLLWKAIFLMAYVRELSFWKWDWDSPRCA